MVLTELENNQYQMIYRETVKQSNNLPKMPKPFLYSSMEEFV
jgi:hypothetical protein